MGSEETDPKVAKKIAKAAAKAAKKGASAGSPPAAEPSAPAGGQTPAERSAAAAERQVALQRWRVILAVVAAAIALITLLVMVFR